MLHDYLSLALNVPPRLFMPTIAALLFGPFVLAGLIVHFWKG